MIWLQDADVTLWHGDVLAVLPEMEAESVDCVVTSPPYWGLRDYGQEGQLGLEPTPEQYVERMVEVFREVRRVLAPHGTVWLNLGDSYAAQRGSGGGGSYDAERPGGSQTGSLTPPDGLKPKDLVGIPWRVAFALQADGWYLRSDIIWAKPNPMPESVTDRPTKAHEYVFLLSKQPRYFFDQEAVREPWQTTHAPGQRVNETQHYGADNGGNTGLTEHLAAVKDRLRAAKRPQDETLLLVDGDVVVDRSGVGVDADAVADELPGTHLVSGGVLLDEQPQLGTDADGEGLAGSGRHTTSVTHGGTGRGPDGRRKTTVQGADGSIQHRDGERWPNGGRNIRSVWDIATQPYPEAHFATFPEELARRCIAAGTSERGKCPECGAPWVRITEKVGDAEHLDRFGRPVERRTQDYWKKDGRDNRVRTETTAGVPVALGSSVYETKGWQPSCKANCVNGDKFRTQVPCVVLDPFIGSGTVAHVARKLGRHAVGIDLNESYLELAARRLQQQSLFAETR